MKERTQEIVPGVKVLIPSPPPGKTLEFGELSSDLMMMDIPVVD
jgi:hypothetical protein